MDQAVPYAEALFTRFSSASYSNADRSQNIPLQAAHMLLIAKGQVSIP